VAYTEAEQRFIAREVARAGGNLSAAVKHLRERCLDFETISDNTLRRIMRKPGFGELIAAEGSLLRKAAEEGVMAAERDRARREAEGLVINRLARDEIILDECRTMLEKKLADADPRNIAEAINAFKSLAQIIDRRHARTVPAIASTVEAAALVESVSEIVRAKCGTRSQEIVDAIRERFVEKLNAADAAAKDVAVTS